MHKLNERTTGWQMLPIEELSPHPDNPRLPFKDDDVRELAASVEDVDLIAPLVVRPRGGRYQIVCGERRWRAAQLAGFLNVPCDVRELDDEEALELMTRENFDRKELNPIEKARALRNFVDRGLTQEQIGAKFNHTGSWVANLLRLLALPQSWQDKIIAGELSERNARWLVRHAGNGRFLKSVAASMHNYPRDWQGHAFEHSLKALERKWGIEGREDPDDDEHVDQSASTRVDRSEGGNGRVRSVVIPTALSEADCRELLAPYAPADLQMLRDTADRMLAEFPARG